MSNSNPKAYLQTYFTTQAGPECICGTGLLENFNAYLPSDLIGEDLTSYKRPQGSLSINTEASAICPYCKTVSTYNLEISSNGLLFSKVETPEPKTPNKSTYVNKKQY